MIKVDRREKREGEDYKKKGSKKRGGKKGCALKGDSNRKEKKGK